MRKLKLFLENFLVYGFGGIVSKIIPLIMVPIVTRIMPNTEYFGISDLSNTLVSLASAFALMGMYDAMYRMFFEKDDDCFKIRVCSTALGFSVVTSIIVFVIMLLIRNQLAICFFKNEKMTSVVYLSAIAALVGSTNGIISAPTRMQNKRKVFLITNTISPLLSYSIAIPLLLAGHYVIALPLAAVISGAVMEASFGILNFKWFKIREFDTELLKQMLVIALPLLPNFLIYWVFNSCDRVMITNMIGIGDAGIYAVGAKLGHVSQLIYTAFAGGWQFFAFSTMNEENQVESNSKVFEYLGVISFVATTFICAWSFGIFKLLFTEEYLRGFIIAPYLFLAPLLQMLFQVESNQFLVVKKTWPNMFLLTLGALINIVLNIALIPILGIEGAAIASLIGYIVSDAICTVVLCKMGLMIIKKRFIFVCIMMMAFILIWRTIFSERILIGTAAAILCTMIILLLYKDDLFSLVGLLKNETNNLFSPNK